VEGGGGGKGDGKGKGMEGRGQTRVEGRNNGEWNGGWKDTPGPRVQEFGNHEHDRPLWETLSGNDDGEDNEQGRHNA